LNLGKRGMSTSLGGHDTHVTVGRNTWATVSAPGTGLSYTVVWGARLLGAAVMMALLAPAEEAEGGRARGVGDRHKAGQDRRSTAPTRRGSSVSAQLTAHSMLRRDGTEMVSTINEVDTTDERSLKPFET
jgi:hypothetical protein